MKMDNYSGWEGYYDSSNAQSIWKEDVESFLIDNSEILLSTNKKINVLDIACGDGRNTAFFYHNDDIICCVDISETALVKLGRKYPKTIRICENFINTGLTNEQFDIVICFDGLPQMEDPSLALNKMIELTKQDGYIVFNLFTPNDCAYGEGEKIDECTFNFKNTLFKFYTFQQAEMLIPSNVKILKKEVKFWNDPPHGEFRPYPHQHEASFFLLKKI